MPPTALENPTADLTELQSNAFMVNGCMFTCVTSVSPEIPASESEAWMDKQAICSTTITAIEQALAAEIATWQNTAMAEVFSKKPEISTSLTDATQIQELNAEYRDKNKPTDVLSFPMYPDIHAIQKGGMETLQHDCQNAPLDMPSSLGDIVISITAVRQVLEAANKDAEFADVFGHLWLHGLLHLLGFDHMDDFEEEEMQQVEMRVLAKAGLKPVYDALQQVAESM